MYLGAVHMVDPVQRFALLRIIGPVPRAGATLISHPADGSTSRIGNLVVSEDQSQRRGIVVADIRSGSVERGDRIFMYRNISQQPEPTERILDTVVTEVPTDMPPANRPAEDARPLSPQPARPAGEPAAAPSEDAFAEPVSAPATDAPELPSPPVDMPRSSSHSQEKAPSYLDDIPNDINQWD